jgi:uncharacterized protein (TIGR00369 family)
MELQKLLEDWLMGESEPPPVIRLLGIELVECEEGISKMELSADDKHHNPMGFVHGGIYCDLADAAMGTALASVMEPGETFATTDLSTNYFIPMRRGILRAYGRVVRKGRDVAYMECEMTAEDGKLIAKSSSTCLILRAEAPGG